MKKRLFVAINLPDYIKDKISKWVEEKRCLFTNDIRFLKSENWHITLAFLGYQPDEFIEPILRSMKVACDNYQSQDIEFVDITYGPKKATPRMIWLNGSTEAANGLVDIKKDLEDSLVNNSVNFKREHRAMNVHVTLARFQNISKTKLPEINTEFNFKFRVESLDLMESHLSRSGANYELLQRINFRL